MALPLGIFPILTAAGTTFRFAKILSFLGALAASAVAFFSQWFTRKVAMQLGIITTIGVVTLAVFTTIKALIASVSIVTPDYISQGFSMITPDNFWFCSSLIASAKITRWVWIWKYHFISRLGK